MRYDNDHLTFEAQADLLLGRGLAADRGVLVERLKSVNYFRFSGYLEPFLEKSDEKKFSSGTTLEAVWDRYIFDRQFRLLVLDGIERIEVYLGTALAYHHSGKHGPFGYTVPRHLPNLPEHEFLRFLQSVLTCKHQLRKEAFVQSYNSQHDDEHVFLPIWMMTETLSFGSILTLFRGVEDEIQETISDSLNTQIDVFKSWILSLNTIRNICAHHGRLWDRELSLKPKIPRQKHKEWHEVHVGNNRCFGILTIEKALLNIIAPESRWAIRLKQLLEAHPNIPLKQIGFSKGWEQSTIWR